MAKFGPHQFSLQDTIDHHGPSIYSGYYITSINCCENIPLQWQQIMWFEMIDIKKKTTLLHMQQYVSWLCVLFGLEQEDSNAIIHMALTHPLHPN